MGEPAFLCPACHTPLPARGGDDVVACPACAVEVDLARAGTAAGRPRFVPEPDRTGETVGAWRLQARLGAGGMGTIYRAVRAPDAANADPHHALVAAGSPPPAVALKMLGAGLAHDPPAITRFLREVALLRDLDHPHIVRVLDSGMHQGVPWFAMELVEGEDLRQRLLRGPLEPAEARRLVRELFSALGAAHARGIVHRDLKPANVLLSPQGTKLADFGVAAPDDSRRAFQTQLTESAAVLGTLPYMSPEQRAGRRVEARSDLFSAGVLLYEALTGQLPMGAFPRASSLNPTFPPAVDGVLAALLHPEPGARPADAAEAAARWEKAMTPRPSLVRRASAVLLALLALGSAGAVVRSEASFEHLARLPLARSARRSFVESRGVVLPAPPRFGARTDTAGTSRPPADVQSPPETPTTTAGLSATKAASFAKAGRYMKKAAQATKEGLLASEKASTTGPPSKVDKRAGLPRKAAPKNAGELFEEPISAKRSPARL